MLHFLFGLKGRIPRARFCFFATVAFIVFLMLMAALYAYDIMAGNYENGGPVPWPTSGAGIAGAAIWFAVLFLLAVSFLGVSLKRLHDRDKAWWWLLVFFAIPNALSSLGEYLRQSGSALALACNAAAYAILAWAFVELACLRGTSGENRFGPDPLAHTR